MSQLPLPADCANLECSHHLSCEESDIPIAQSVGTSSCPPIRRPGSKIKAQSEVEPEEPSERPHIKRRRSPRTSWENFDSNDFRQAFIGERDTDGFWIRCSICDVELSCGQFFRYRLVRLSSHIAAVHTLDRLQSTKSQTLQKWLTFSPQSQIQLASNDTEVAVLLCHRTRGIKASPCLFLNRHS